MGEDGAGDAVAEDVFLDAFLAAFLETFFAPLSLRLMPEDELFVVTSVLVPVSVVPDEGGDVSVVSVSVGLSTVLVSLVLGKMISNEDDVVALVVLVVLVVPLLLLTTSVC